MARSRAKEKNLDFDIDKDYIFSLWDGKCSITKVPLDLSRPEVKGQPRWNAPSLDRIKPNLGYVKGNVRIVAYQINVAMMDYGLEHLLEVCSLLVEQN